MKPESIRADRNPGLSPKLLKPESSTRNFFRQAVPEISSLSVNPDFVLMQENSIEHGTCRKFLFFRERAADSQKCSQVSNSQGSVFRESEISGIMNFQEIKSSQEIKNSWNIRDYLVSGKGRRKV